LRKRAKKKRGHRGGKLWQGDNPVRCYTSMQLGIRGCLKSLIHYFKRERSPASLNEKITVWTAFGCHIFYFSDTLLTQALSFKLRISARISLSKIRMPTTTNQHVYRQKQILTG
jgi:hypothetical protein